MRPNEFILILDFGSQYTQLIARRIREAGVYSEIQPFNFPVDEIAKIKPKGIILSGGPASVYENGSPQVDVKLFQLGIPVLGICYGLQLIAYKLGGEVDRFAKREYGKAILKIEKDDDLFYDLNSEITVWMSHGDALVKAPPGFEVIAQTENSPICVIRNREKKIYGVQFHPEVVHTEKGFEILKNFVYRICQCQGGWNAEFFIENEIKEIRETVKDKSKATRKNLTIFQKLKFFIYFEFSIRINPQRFIEKLICFVVITTIFVNQTKIYKRVNKASIELDSSIKIPFSFLYLPKLK